MIFLFGTSIASAQGLMELDLRLARPTQSALGFRVVERKIRDLSRMTEMEREKFLIQRAAPVIIGPDNTIYVQDRQHEFAALIQLGIFVGYGRISGNYSNLSWPDFKDVMTERRKVYLRRMGIPIAFDELPTRIEAMIDDPLRSVASEIRKQGAYRKSPEPFGENEWADELRKVISIEVAQDFPEAAHRMGKVFSGTTSASHLPGYITIRKDCRQLHLKFSAP